MVSEECHRAQVSGDIICVSGADNVRALPEPLRLRMLCSSIDVIDKEQTYKLVKDTVMTSLKNV